MESDINYFQACLVPNNFVKTCFKILNGLNQKRQRETLKKLPVYRFFSLTGRANKRSDRHLVRLSVCLFI